MIKKKNLYHDQSMWKGASPQIFSNAKSLREKMTQAEIILWEEIKGNKLEGYKFRRQHPIHKFVADFYCHKLKLIIEVDGEYHENKDQVEADIQRSELLKYHGVEVIRFSNEEILSNIEEVVKRIKEKMI